MARLSRVGPVGIPQQKGGSQVIVNYSNIMSKGNFRFAANKGMVLGNGRFEAEVENLTGQRMTAKKMGRPIGWRKKKQTNNLSLL